jgi:hypothetical protein
MAEFIYTMKKARKAHGDKVILDDVTIMFYPGAKIGVVGPNGAGKSTVLQIMAGLQQPSNGEAYLTPGYTVGILLQEPHLDETKNVIDNVKEGVAETVAMLARFDEISAEMANPDADYDKLLAEMGELQEQLDHRNAWEMQMFQCYLVEKNAALLCVSCYCKHQIFCFLMSLQITWMLNLFCGWSSTSTSMQAQLLRLLTIDTSWTMLHSGFLNSTAVVHILMKEITRPTLRQRQHV